MMPPSLERLDSEGVSGAPPFPRGAAPGPIVALQPRSEIVHGYVPQRPVPLVVELGLMEPARICGTRLFCPSQVATLLSMKSTRRRTSA